MINEYQDFLDNFDENPLIYDDIVEMIYKNSTPDIVMHKILKKLRRKWGGVIGYKKCETTFDRT